MNREGPLLLVIATGSRLYREYLLRSISTEFRIHLFHTAEPGWECDYLAGWTVLPSTADGPAMAVIARELARREPIAGVLCWDEARILATSYVAEALGLRNGDPAVLARLRDKGQTRAALAAHGVPQPASLPVASLSGALAAADRIGYPVVLKPRALGASLGVVRVDDEQQLRAQFRFARDARSPEPVDVASDAPVLVEQCVTGEEISVDAMTRNGVCTPLFVGRKVVGFPPYAEEIGHYVRADDPLLTDPALFDVLQDAHRALGFSDGWTHSEFMLTESGPQVIEVNGRLGGDQIPYLGLLATGIDPGLVAARVACGLPPGVTRTRSRTAGIRFFYVDREDTTIASVRFNCPDPPEPIERMVTVAQPGAVVSPPPKGTVWGRIAFAIAVADSVSDCAAALDRVQDALEVNPEVEMIPPREPARVPASREQDG